MCEIGLLQTICYVLPVSDGVVCREEVSGLLTWRRGPLLTQRLRIGCELTGSRCWAVIRIAYLSHALVSSLHACAPSRVLSDKQR